MRNISHFSISGPGGGVHWAFKRADIAFVGLVVELPDPDHTHPKTIDISDEPQYEKQEGE
jgi:hypothetical protein